MRSSYIRQAAPSPMTLEDWVLAEKDLVNSIEADNLEK